MTNCCAFDCSYCVNRKSNDIPRATFTPRELAELTVEFYRRNYIEGLFLSSAVLGTPDYTTERMLATLRLLRGEYRFGGYIHAKAIPGTSPELLQQLGYLADRLSVNVELPSEQSLNLLAPDKGRHSIFRPMKQIAVSGAQSKQELTVYRHAPKFAPAGRERITQALIDPNVFGGSCEQLSLFTPPAVDDLITQGVAPRAAMRMVREEAVQCLAKAL